MYILRSRRHGSVFFLAIRFNTTLNLIDLFFVVYVIQGKYILHTMNNIHFYALASFFSNQCSESKWAFFCKLAW